MLASALPELPRCCSKGIRSPLRPLGPNCFEKEKLEGRREGKGSVSGAFSRHGIWEKRGERREGIRSALSDSFSQGLPVGTEKEEEKAAPPGCG